MTSLEIFSSDVMFNVARELSQTMGNIDFPNAAKNRTNSGS